MNQREQLRQLVYDVSTYLEDDVFHAVCGSEEELDQLVDEVPDDKLIDYVRKFEIKLQEREYEFTRTGN